MKHFQILVEIHDMFIDLSNLVSMQGEMVDRIEDHINSEYLPTYLASTIHSEF
jgi:hypothetical protein